MEGALVVGAVAEEGNHHARGLAALGRQRRADRDRDAATHDPVGAEIALGDVRDMHGATAAMAIAGLLAEEFGEHPPDIRSFGDAVAVTAMGGGDVVGVRERHADADRAGFLPDRQVHRAVDEASHVGLFGPFLEEAYKVHLLERLTQRLAAEPAIDVGKVGAAACGRTRDDLTGLEKAHGWVPKPGSGPTKPSRQRPDCRPWRAVMPAGDPHGSRAAS